MESSVTICEFLSFSSLFSFESGGISERFCVPFLLRMCMSFLLIFIFRFIIFVAAIMHNECMRPWAFDCAHVDEFGLLLCQGFDKVLKRRHLLGGSRGKSDSMECRYEYREFKSKLGENGENHLFLLLRFINPQALSCDSKSLNFVNKSCKESFELGVLQEDIRKRRSGEIRLQIVLSASSMRFKYLDFSMADVDSVSVFMVNVYNPLDRRCMVIFSFHAK
jgi:hypothetical protein